MRVLLIAALLLSGSAFAANSGSSWDAIYKAGLWPAFAKVDIKGYHVSVADLCVDGNQLRANDPIVSECNIDMMGEIETCAGYTEVYLSTPITFTETFCAEVDGRGECARYETITSSHALSYDVDVIEGYTENFGGRVAFTKAFEIPACAE